MKLVIVRVHCSPNLLYTLPEEELHDVLVTQLDRQATGTKYKLFKAEKS